MRRGQRSERRPEAFHPFAPSSTSVGNARMFVVARTTKTSLRRSIASSRVSRRTGRRGQSGCTAQRTSPRLTRDRLPAHPCASRRIVSAAACACSATRLPHSSTAPLFSAARRARSACSSLQWGARCRSCSFAVMAAESVQRAGKFGERLGPAVGARPRSSGPKFTTVTDGIEEGVSSARCAYNAR